MPSGVWQPAHRAGDERFSHALVSRAFELRQLRQRRAHVVESVEQPRIDTVHVTECFGHIEASAGLTRRAEPIAVTLPARATLSPAPFRNVASHPAQIASPLP